VIGWISKALSRASLACSVVGLLAVTGIILWQVVARYGLNAAPAWTEQAALFLMIYFVLFAAAVGVREGFHIRLTMLIDALPPLLAKALTILSHGVVAAFGVVLTIYGLELIDGTWAHDIPTLGLPRGAAYIPLPIAGVLIVFFSLEHILALLQNRKVEPLWN
jgi:TRAP-type C4-dicarboxylate transport system permease small subunit